jgi:hypothetical protein
MSLFESLGCKQQQQKQPPLTREQAMQQIQADPRTVLSRCGLNIPDGVNDPQQMVSYLFRSGQIGRNLRKIK